MRSLRSRLILGSSLIAVVPLVVAMVLLAQRIETMVRTQAAERLNAALGTLRVELLADGERIAEQLRILGNDPQLKRLYLLRPAGSRDLSEYLAERRHLLGVDLLQVVDAGGAVVADGSTIPSPTAARDPWRLEPAGPRPTPFGLVRATLDGSSGLALVASAPIRYENAAVGSLLGGLVLDAGFLARMKRTSGVELVLHDAAGRAVATTLDGAIEPALPARGGVERVELGGRPYLRQRSRLEMGALDAGIVGLVSTAAADRTIAGLHLASALLGIVGLVIAVLLGILWSSQVSRPVERLAAFSRRVAQGDWDEPLTLHSVRELEILVAALDRMRRDLATYRDRLVTSERQAAWSQMARKVAHEIKNPLTPIAVSVADLQRSYELKRPDFPQILAQAVRTIADEVETLKRLLQEFSDFGRFPAPRLGPCRLSSLWTDLGTLYGHEVAVGRLAFSRPDRDITFTADAGQIRQAIVNLIKNGLETLDGDGRVVVTAGAQDGALEISVSDTGPGLSAEQRSHLFVPGFTTKVHGSGLGLTIVERIVNDHLGTISADSLAGSGTTFRIRLPLEQSPPASLEPREPPRA